MIFCNRDADTAASRGRWLFLAGLLIATWLLTGAMEAPKQPPPLDPAEAARQGKALAADLLSRTPVQNGAISGLLKIRNGQDVWKAVPIRFDTIVGTTNWKSFYTVAWPNRLECLLVIHETNGPNTYYFDTNAPGSVPAPGNSPVLEHLLGSHNLSSAKAMTPFAGSDFWVADLGLEFFHWPEQRLLKSEMRRSRSCRVLQSVNPNPAPGAYTYVNSWIDIESGGIVFAEAYDFKSKLLKEFAPKDFEKVRGQWQLKEMKIDNRQTGSSAWIEFDLGQK